MANEGRPLSEYEITFGSEQLVRSVFLFTNLSANEPEAVKSKYLITSIKVVSEYGHDRVTVWNRGACSGTLTVKEGDGIKFGELLTTGNDYWKGEYVE